MREIGLIKLVQVQRSSLKQGQRPQRYYDPAPLLVVERLLLAPGGVSAVSADGESIIDIHHADHPETKNSLGKNGISFGFTGHYRAMRERYGAHLPDGCAGENILIESDRVWSLDELGTSLIIQRADGQLVTLDCLMTAAPCVEFSRFAHLSAEPLTSDQLRTTLQFLDGGMRGFYARLVDGQPDAEIRSGDRVFVS
ncbi:MAG: hypothetical protein M3R61_16310 [Chloroflexota bacterium]|nr:hypothetical protein [Chloroflexota bacterium]